MPKRNYKVIVKTSVEDAPEHYELSAALILAYYFKADVTFLRVQHGKTPDIELNDITWEIKSPLGSSKKTIENNLRLAGKQSHNVILDLRRSKMHQTSAMSRIRYFLARQRHIKRLIVITKDKRVVDIL